MDNNRVAYIKLGSVSPQVGMCIKSAFNLLYYGSEVWNGRNTRWLGFPVYQNPCDMWVMQEILFETRPDVLIECGSGCGGSALFYVSVWPGHVISIDNQMEMTVELEHERIEFVTASSTDEWTVRQVKEAVKGKRVMVYLDSDHHPINVLRELETWGSVVSEGCYMVVHDTNLNGRPIPNAIHPGLEGLDPAAAVDEFLKKHLEFKADREREKFMLTFSPGGFLKKETV